MQRFFVMLLMLLASLVCRPAKYKYQFNDTPVSKALLELVKQHPDAKITFIYNELENYTTSASINTDNLNTAIKEIIGLNPITLVEKKKYVLLEALQKGKYCYTGTLINEYREPVAHATILLLNPKDSVVITYGITKKDGRFVIPCDICPVTAKISSTGYKTLIRKFTTSSLGDIRMNTLTIDLDSITVLADEARMLSDRSVFIPLERQKNSAMTGVELLERMNIPQIRINPTTGELETNIGKPVSVFINYAEATEADITGMNIQDVKRVEYYEFSSNPRFLGKRYVINFIMTKYEYGGYTRFYGYEHAISNKNNIQVNSRLQSKKMTYDIAAGVNHEHNRHEGNKTVETYRLPQSDGSLKTFDRISTTLASKKRQMLYTAAVKAGYGSDKINIQNEIIGTLDDSPGQYREGYVSYIPTDFQNSSYNSFAKQKTKSIRYRGSFYFSMPHNSSMTFTPRYSFSHTEQSSVYTEQSFTPVDNQATDNAQWLYAHLNYVRKVRTDNTFILFGSTSFHSYHTCYAGSANSYDKSNDLQFMSGAAYNYTNNKINGEFTFAWICNKIRFNEVKTLQHNPLFDLSLQYLFSSNHQLNGSFHYEPWNPSVSYKSDNVIRANHLMSYTGNPNLVPSKTYDVDLSYNWIPSNKGYISVYGSLWAVKNRYVYNYEANAHGILRTICQPLGDYLIGQFGVTGRLTFFDGNLRLTGRLSQYYNHNGAPYRFSRSNISYNLNADYYYDNLYFNASFTAPRQFSDGYMNGIWVKIKSHYYLQAGWANKNWNIRITANNFARWNWKLGKQWFNTKFYDNSTWIYNTILHADFRITCTYTFNYGKKVRSDGEPTTGSSENSGILKQ